MCHHRTVLLVLFFKKSAIHNSIQTISRVPAKDFFEVTIDLSFIKIHFCYTTIVTGNVHFRVKSRAHDPPIDNPVCGISTIASVKTQNSADLTAGHMETNASGDEEEGGRHYHVLEGPLPESSINSENYVFPGEEDSSEDSASVQSFELPVSKHGNVGEEEEDEYRELVSNC